MSTPPDHLGEDRPPIAATVPSPIELQSDATTPAVGSGPLPIEPICDPQQRRLRSKAAYRARRSDDDSFREAERQRAGEWRRNHPEKARAQKRKARSERYHRPFVSVDAEGQDYPGADIMYDGVRYPRHDTYLWGAATDDRRPPIWLTASETSGLDKRPLDAIRILDWLLSLPQQFGPAVFVIFSGGYDFSQILKHLPYEKAWQIEKRETYRDQNGKRRRIGHSPVLWKGYAISFVKGKSLDVWRLADPEKPYRGKKLHTTAHVRIYDVFGFFQSSFSAVVKSMVDSGRATTDEADFIAEMKEKRDQFANEEIEQIKAYTTLELRLLARMMGDLRSGFEEMGLRLRHWHGAGAGASALIESQKLKKHFGGNIAASNISLQQTAAHHAYYGGRIELLKQGYIENRALHVLDVASAYPAAMVEFPSLASGEWSSKPGTEFRKGSLRRPADSSGSRRVMSCRCSRFDFSSRHTRETPCRCPQGSFHSLLSTCLIGTSAVQHPVSSERLRLVHAGRCSRGHSLVGALRSRLSAVDDQAASSDGVRYRRGLDFSAKPRRVGQPEALQFCSRSLC